MAPSALLPLADVSAFESRNTIKSFLLRRSFSYYMTVKKVKFSLSTPERHVQGSGKPHALDPLLPGGKFPVPIEYEAGWASKPIWRL